MFRRAACVRVHVHVHVCVLCVCNMDTYRYSPFHWIILNGYIYTGTIPFHLHVLRSIERLRLTSPAVNQPKHPPLYSVKTAWQESSNLYSDLSATHVTLNESDASESIT